MIPKLYPLIINNIQLIFDGNISTFNLLAVLILVFRKLQLTILINILDNLGMIEVKRQLGKDVL